MLSSGVPPGKAAVMQICGDKGNCYVLHIFHSGIPLTLQSLLEDPTVVKVGISSPFSGTFIKRVMNWTWFINFIVFG